MVVCAGMHLEREKSLHVCPNSDGQVEKLGSQTKLVLFGTWTGSGYPGTNSGNHEIAPGDPGTVPWTPGPIPEISVVHRTGPD